jgi:hypothetical protein
MSEFKDKIPAATAKVEFHYDPVRGIAPEISGTRVRALYMVAVSLDGRYLLDTVPAGGIGTIVIYRQPSIVTFIQSDEQGLWGRNCPACRKYFRTNHIMDVTWCPYCAESAPSLAFVSVAQRTYITAYYDAYARAHIEKKNTTLDIAEVTDVTPAWHYSEEKQQFHFTCDGPDCKTQADIMGEYGYCPSCGRTNARRLFAEKMDKLISRIAFVKATVDDRHERERVWEEITKACVSDFEPLGKHLRRKLLCFPMTPKRRKQVEELSFQQLVRTNDLMQQWFDIGMLEWAGNAAAPAVKVAQSEVSFIKMMVHKRHILVHNGGLVDQEYLEHSGDDSVRLDERIRINRREAIRFVEAVRVMAANLLNNVEEGFQ